jgi:hypothetical protein
MKSEYKIGKGIHVFLGVISSALILWLGIAFSPVLSVVLIILSPIISWMFFAGVLLGFGLMLLLLCIVCGGFRV